MGLHFDLRAAHLRVAPQLDHSRVIRYGFGYWRYYAVGEGTL